MFSKFLTSVYGGSKSIKFMKMDITNIYKLISGVSEQYLFNSRALNIFFSNKEHVGVLPQHLTLDLNLLCDSLISYVTTIVVLFLNLWMCPDIWIC